MMKICGLQKTTLLDYPGHVAATVFLEGCNFRCPFCHNRELLGNDAEELMTAHELLVFLKKRRHVLEGVCITGGEPTLSPEIGDFLGSIKELGYKIKLDSNGSDPETLKQLCGEGLLDYVAMDIKNSPDKYPETSGNRAVRVSAIAESAAFLIGGRLPYEFRTTVVKELHVAEDFIKIAALIQGADAYYLQNYTDSPQVLTPGFSGCTWEELLTFADLVRPYVKMVEIRGVDH